MVATNVYVTQVIDKCILEKVIERNEGSYGLSPTINEKIASVLSSDDRNKLSEYLISLIDPDLDVLLGKIFSCIDSIEKLDKIISA